MRLLITTTTVSLLSESNMEVPLKYGVTTFGGEWREREEARPFGNGRYHIQTPLLRGRDVPGLNVY